MSQTLPFFISIPHSGEQIPDLAPWLRGLSETLLMSDVDRFVDVLYAPALTELGIPHQKTQWHRYAVDLNRIPEDIDASSVNGAVKPAGTHPDGYHWVMTKNGESLMKAPMTLANHQALTELIYDPFHAGLKQHYKNFQSLGAKQVFHLDVHSMPSVGTSMHRDPGELRAEVVISDCLGKSCHRKYRDLVIAAYATAGFKVGYNWPYMGGRVTEQYGRPQSGQQVLQVELSRATYMDEKTKQLLPEHKTVQGKILSALNYIKSELPKLNL